MGGEGRALTPTLLTYGLCGLNTSRQSPHGPDMRSATPLTPLFMDPLNHPLLDHYIAYLTTWYCVGTSFFNPHTNLYSNRRLTALVANLVGAVHRHTLTSTF
jgi:hypothetical protein